MAVSQWGLCVAAFAPLLAAWPGVASPYTVPKLLVLAVASALAAAAALAAARGASAVEAARPKAPAGADLLRPLAAGLAAVALAAVFSSHVPTSLLGDYSQRAYGLLGLGLCAAVAAFAQASGTAAAARGLAWGPAAGAVLAAVGLLQLRGLDPVLNAVGELTGGRAGSWVGSPVALGCVLAMLVPLALRSALDGESPGRRRSGWAFLGLMLLGLAATLSRGAWLAAAAAAAAYLLGSGRALTRRTLAALAVAAVLGGGAAVALTGRSRATAHSDSGRMATWRAAWSMFAAHPLLGVGPDAFTLALGRHKGPDFLRAYGPAGRQGHAHNDILQALATTGAVGLAAYLWLLVAAWRRFKNALREPSLRADAAAAGAGLLAAFLVAKVNPLNLDALALAAAFLGWLDPRGAPPRVPAGVVAGSSAAAVLAAGWLFLADRACLAGMRAQREGRLDDAVVAYAAAARLVPTESSYGFWLVGLLRERARTDPDHGWRRTFAEEAVAAARVMERANPGDVRALHALGGSLAALSIHHGPDHLAEAAAVLERGVAADWSYRSLLETRRTVANLRKDRAAYDDSAARLARLDALVASPQGGPLH